MSGWPAVRTVPVPRAAGAGWAQAAGCLFVLVVAPVLCGLAAKGLLALDRAFDLTNVDDGVYRPSLIGYVGALLWMVAWSPVLSWLFLLASLPVSEAALRRGWAGWLVAMGCGALMAEALLAVLAMAFFLQAGKIGAFSLLAPNMSHLIGALLGGWYWLGARLARPGLFVSRGSRSV